MTLRPGGSFPMRRRAHHRARHAFHQQQRTQQSARARAATPSGTGSLSGTDFNAAAPYVLRGKYISSDPQSRAMGTAASPKAQRAIRSQKAM